jgi:hypothetical protein
VPTTEPIHWTIKTSDVESSKVTDEDLLKVWICAKGFPVVHKRVLDFMTKVYMEMQKRLVHNITLEATEDEYFVINDKI